MNTKLPTNLKAELKNKAVAAMKRGQWYGEEKLVSEIYPEPTFSAYSDRDEYHADMQAYWLNVYHAVVGVIREIASARNLGMNCYAWRLK